MGLGLKKKTYTRTSDAKSALSRGVARLGTFIRQLIDVLQAIIKPILIIVGAAILFALTVAWLASIFGLTFGAPILSFLFPDQGIYSGLSVINILVLISVPLLSIGIFILRLLFGTRMNKYWSNGLAIFWGLNLTSLFFIAGRIGSEFNIEQSYTSQVYSDLAADSDTLYISNFEMFNEEVWLSFDDHIKVSNDWLISREIVLNIEQSDSGQFELLHRQTARGPSSEEAIALARAISYELEITGNQVRFPREFMLEKGTKWRNQRVELTLKVPIGKYVVLDPAIQEHLGTMSKDHSVEFPWRLSECDAWLMSAKGLQCPGFNPE
jgi:hypothetical protein